MNPIIQGGYWESVKIYFGSCLCFLCKRLGKASGGFRIHPTVLVARVDDYR
jgi:hypothetical protein